MEVLEHSAGLRSRPDVDDKLHDIQITLAKINIHLEGFLEKFDQHVQDDKEIKARVETIEKRQYQAAGVIGAVIFFWGMLSDKVLALIGLK